ncbi:MAG: hypothetical protein Q9173_005199 [Seirophora scorigena]
MTWVTVPLIQLTLLIISTTATPTPAPAPAPTSPRARFLPACFPDRPHCIRPRVDECRDAITIMAAADPGYPIQLGRKEVIEDSPRAYRVPWEWSSLPINCIVKLDVTDPKAVELLLLRSLTTPAELVIRTCILGGTKCGGSILVGPNKVLALTLAYYSDVGLHGPGSVLVVGRNRTELAYTEA